MKSRGEKMVRGSALFWIIGITLILGCNSSPAPQPEATLRSTGGHMPAGSPKYESFYVADQSTIRMVAARTISDKPLESFRSGEKESKVSEEKESAEDNGESKNAKAAKKGKTGDEEAEAPAISKPKVPGGFWTKLGAKAMAGGASKKSAEKEDGGTTSNKTEPKKDNASKKPKEIKRPVLGG